MNNKELAKYIDHTLLKPQATDVDIKNLCLEAKKYGFPVVCVNLCYVPLCVEQLKDTDIKVCTVVGFPLGAVTPKIKMLEASEGIKLGAEEIDMVMNIGALKSGDEELVYEEIKKVREATRGKILKVIIETALLTDEEKVKACLIAKRAEADFVKTSTGFGPGGATVEDVQLMRKTVGPDMGVKASGGIRTAEQAWALIKAGATRIGTSAGVAIVTGKSKNWERY